MFTNLATELGHQNQSSQVIISKPNLKPYSKLAHIWCLEFHYSPTEPKISHKPTPILLEPPRVGTQPFPNFPILTAKSPFPNLFHQLCHEITTCFLVKDGFQSPFQSPWPQKSPFQSPLVKSSQMSLMVSSHHWFSLVESPLVKSSKQKIKNISHWLSHDWLCHWWLKSP